MSDNYADDFFVVNRWILRWASVWKPENGNKNIQTLYMIYAVVVFVLVDIYFIGTEFLSLISKLGNEYESMKICSFLLTHLMGASKVLFFHFRGVDLRKIMSTLESAQFRYGSCPEKGFFPGETSKRFKRVGIMCSMLFLLMAHVTLMSSYVPSLVAALQHVEGNPEKPLPDRMPYYSWMPFRFDTTLLYVIALVYQATLLFFQAHCIVGMDTLFMNIMNCIGMNLEIIQGAFFTVRERASEKVNGPLLTPDGIYNSEELKTALNDEMKKIIKHLQTIYKMCDDLEDLYKFLTLAQTIATLFILCSCLYLVSTVPATSEQFLMSEVVYMIAMGFQLILYCWFGNEVTLKADELPFHIWQCDWISADTEFKKSIILTMARAKRPLYLTAGKFAPLTLATFVSIVKASYSFCTVIKKSSH